MSGDNSTTGQLNSSLPVRKRRLARRRVTALVLMVTAVSVGLVLMYAGGLPLSPQLTIVSGESMEPTMHTGDLLLTRSSDNYSVGEQVVYRVPKGQPGEGSSVVHRVVGNDENGYLMQGDNNSFRDPWRPSDQDIVGTRVLLVPKLGWVLAYLDQPVVVAALMGGLLTGTMTFSSLSSREENDEGSSEPDGDQADRQVIDLRATQHHDEQTATARDDRDVAQPDPVIDLRATQHHDEQTATARDDRDAAQPDPVIDLTSGSTAKEPVAPDAAESAEPDRRGPGGAQSHQPEDTPDQGGA